MKLREEQKNEAIKRMELLGLQKYVIDAFSDKGQLYYSSGDGTLTEFDKFSFITDDFKEYIKEYERVNKAVVYHALFNLPSIKLFVVGEEKEHWSIEKKILSMGTVMCHVCNKNYFYDDELVPVRIDTWFGGIKELS